MVLIGQRKRTEEVIINYVPHDEQSKVHDSKARFRVLVCGRRWGKTTLAVQEMIMEAVNKPKSRIFYVSPTYRQSKMIAFKMIKDYLPEKLIKNINLSELTFLLANGSEISLKGADTEDGLKGVGLTFVVLDEFASMRANAWYEELRPTLADSGGRAMFIGTPKGRNHFYDLFVKDGNDYESFRFRTEDNPYIPKEEIEEMRKDMPESLFRQEVLAEFLDDSSGVFRGVQRCIVGELKSPVLGRFYVMGVDLAKTVDFTVLTVIDSVTREVVAFERFQDLSWKEQKFRVQRLAAKYNNALCLLDQTGVGDPVLEDLQSSNISVEGFKFSSNLAKREVIENLSIAIEQRRITFPKELDILTKELLEFGYNITNSGNITYSAPSGKHDDCVISLALAVWSLRSQLKEAQVLSEELMEIEQDRQGQGVLVNNEEYEEEYAGY